MVDHSSETLFAGWIDDMSDVSKTFNDSPLKQCQINPLGFTLHLLAQLMQGMNGDHAANEKCTGRLLDLWRKNELLLELGKDELLSKTPQDLVILLVFWNDKKFAAVGGIDAWNALSSVEHDTLHLWLTQHLGAQLFSCLIYCLNGLVQPILIK
jgi:hypothetical protein